MGVEFLLGILASALVWAIASYLLRTREWKNRRRLESRVDRIWKHLSCSKGYLGCDGGPKCNWDHK